VLQTGVTVVERHSSVKGLVDLHFGAGKAEAARLLRDLEAAAFPLHDVVVADGALVKEAADAVEAVRCGTPGGFHLAGLFGETAVVVGDESAQHGVGGVEIMSASKAEFAAQAILQHAPEAFDAAFGLRAVGGDEGDGQLFQGAAELGRLTFTGELFLDGPVVVVADEDAAVIAVKSERHTVAAEQLFQQAEIAESGFRGEELGGQDFAGGVVLHAKSGELGAAAFEPVVWAAVELHEFAEARGTHTALAMSGSAAFSRRPETMLTQQAAQGFATQGKAFALGQLLAKMVVVKARVDATRELHDALAHGVRQAAMTGPAAVGVSQSRLPVFAHTLLQALNLAHAQAQESGGSGTRHASLDACTDHAHSLQFLLTQRESLLSHRVTFSRCR
jgi:hypothetical protein